MKTLRITVLCALLVGCAPPPPFSVRNADVGISSSTRFEAAQFAGVWYSVQSVTGPTLGGCADAVWDFEPSALLMTCQSGVSRYDIAPAGPGRLQATSGPFNADPLWVLWVDEDHQTAAIGTPSGHFAFILNRKPDLRADRLQAARDVLRFNGYDLSKVKSVRTSL